MLGSCCAVNTGCGGSLPYTCVSVCVFVRVFSVEPICLLGCYFCFFLGQLVAPRRLVNLSDWDNWSSLLYLWHHMPTHPLFPTHPPLLFFSLFSRFFSADVKRDRVSSIHRNRKDRRWEELHGRWEKKFPLWINSVFLATLHFFPSAFMSHEQFAIIHRCLLYFFLFALPSSFLPALFLQSRT